MIDRSFGDYGQMMRMPDLRIDGVRTAVFEGIAPFVHCNPQSDRGTLVYLTAGDFSLAFEGADNERHPLREGTALGFEDGRAHRFESLSPPGTRVELLVSSIPLKMSVLRQLNDRFMAVPPDAEPYASAMRMAVQLHRYQHLTAATQDDGVIRRCAEICLIQFVNYAREAVAAAPNAPARLSHDEYLLRAWIAYSREPRRRWTVAALAETAGLGRTAFALRFRRMFGAPPLQALTDLRLEQATGMLRDTRAPLIQIAFTSGYNSEAAFVRAFHRRYGVPPGRYRAEREAE